MITLPKLGKKKLLFFKVLLMAVAVSAGLFGYDYGYGYMWEVMGILFTGRAEAPAFFSYEIDLMLGPSVILAAAWISFFWTRSAGFWLIFAGIWVVVQNLISGPWIWKSIWGPIMIVSGLVYVGVSFLEKDLSGTGLRELFLSLSCAILSFFTPFFHPLLYEILYDKEVLLFPFTLLVAGAVLPSLVKNPSRKAILSVSAFSVAIFLLNPWSYLFPFFMLFPLIPFIGVKLNRRFRSEQSTPIEKSPAR